MAKKPSPIDPESARIAEDARRAVNWTRWGPYLAERQWATVREDYSAGGDAWGYFPFENSHLRAYRWGDDGLLGLTDRECRLCFALALWNGKDPVLKERLFGLTGPEGNHGEDVKECYYFLDATPTASYLKGLYKYPQSEFPYQRLRAESRGRNRTAPEYELTDTRVFDQNRYFDVFVEYAKAGPDDVLIRITAHNRGPDAAHLDLLPSLWFRNTWSWGCKHDGCWPKPWLYRDGDGARADHVTLGRLRFDADIGPDGNPATWLYTENETNHQRLFGAPNAGPFTKDAFHEYVIRKNEGAVNTAGRGTKVAAHYSQTIPPGGNVQLRLRLAAVTGGRGKPFGRTFDKTFSDRIREADEFYDRRIPAGLPAEARQVARQSYAGLIWSKQFYHFVVEDWLAGDPEQPKPPPGRAGVRNGDWPHLFSRDVLSMPDTWEYPWFAAWDLAFHMLPFAHIEPHFAKQQLTLLLREWYMHPNGQLPAYEWNFSDVNPPVHAWACWRVYKMTGSPGRRDRLFLARCFQKLLLNFTWWVNRKDVHGRHLFAGGFLGLDNIGMFDRSRPLPNGQLLEQADGTAWMAFYCLTMLAIAIELAGEDPSYEDLASKFFEHFVAITDAMNTLGGSGLWDEEDGFYYDHLHVDGGSMPTRVRSMVGLLPLCAVEVLSDRQTRRLPGFCKRMQWFLDNRRDLARHIAYCEPSLDTKKGGGKRLLAIPSRQRLERVLQRLLDENEFLSPYGVRSLSKAHADKPYVWRSGDEEYRVAYEPGESSSGLFGGNSNWRGPIWFPVNFLLVEALQRYHHFYGDDLRVEFPTGSGNRLNLAEVAAEIAARLAGLFMPDKQGRRPCHGPDQRYADDAHWKDLVLFYEYFHGDTGQGLGASHQTGWTALVATLLEDCSRSKAI